MDRKDYFTYKVIKGSRIYFKPFKIRCVEAPFTFYLIPQEKEFREYKIKIEETEELIYYRRCFGKIQMNSKEDLELDNIIYVVGKKRIDKSIDCYLIDVRTKKEIHYKGYCVECAFKQFLARGNKNEMV